MTERHQYFESRDKWMCDFCVGADATVYFPLLEDNTQTKETSAGPVTIHDTDGWAACPRCARVARRGDPLKLAASVARRTPKPKGGFPPLEWALRKQVMRDTYTRLLPRLDLKGQPLPNPTPAVYRAQGSEEQINLVRKMRDNLHKRRGEDQSSRT